MIHSIAYWISLVLATAWGALMLNLWYRYRKMSKWVEKRMLEKAFADAKAGRPLIILPHNVHLTHLNYPRPFNWAPIIANWEKEYQEMKEEIADDGTVPPPTEGGERT